MKKKLIIALNIATLISLTHSTVSHEINITEKPTKQFVRHFGKLDPKLQEKMLVIQDAIIFLLNLQPITLAGAAGHTHAISSVAIHGDKVITASYDNTVKIWNIHTGELLYTLAADDDSMSGITSLAVSGSKIITGSSNNGVKVWDINIMGTIMGTTGKILLTLTGGDPTYKVTSVAVQDDILITGSYDGTAKMWNIDTGELLHIFTYNAPINTVAIDDNTVVIGGWDNTAKIWDRHTGALLHILTGLEGHASAITSVAIQGNIVITGSYDKTAKIWNTDTGQYIFTLAGRNRHADGITAIATNGDEVVTGSLDNTAKVWDIYTGEFILDLGGPDGHRGSVNAVAISDNTIVTGSWDCTAKIWPLALTLQESPENNPLVWIIQNANRSQLDFIKRAYEATIAGQELIINLPEPCKNTENNSYVSLPPAVREFLRTRLNIKTIETFAFTVDTEKI